MIAPTLLLLAATLPGVNFPGAQPQLDVRGDRVALVYGHENQIWVAASHDRGRTFSTPTKIEGTGKLMLGRHRGPRIALTPNGPVVTANRDGNLWAWRYSKTGWLGPVRVNDLDQVSREGLHAMSTLPDGRLISTWLDLRDNKGMRLYSSISSDGGATWAKNTLVYESPDGHICQCCHPSLAGNFVMWRNALGGSRDFYFDTIPSSGPAQKLGQGTWVLNACPMDGGGIVKHDKLGIGTAWRREKTIYFAEPGQPERAIGDGKDPAITATSAGFWIIWDSPTGIRLERPNRSIEVLAATGAYPSIVAHGSLVVAAWENGAGSIEVHQIQP